MTDHRSLLLAMMAFAPAPDATVRPGKSYAQMITSSPLEITQHNAAVEAKKQMKRRQQLARKAYRNATLGGNR